MNMETARFTETSSNYRATTRCH